MKHIMVLAARWPWPVVLVMLALTALAGAQIPALRVNISAEGMMINDDGIRTFHEHVLQVFGEDDATIVFIADPSLFDAGKLRAIREMQQRLEGLPFVSRTESLFNAKNIRTVDGFVLTKPYLDTIPETPEAAARIREQALQNPLVARNYISEDGTAMAINVFVRENDYHSGYDLEVAKGIEEVLAPFQGRLEQVFQIGAPYVRAAITERIHRDQNTIIPVSLVVLVVTLGLSLKRLNASLIPLITAGLSIVWTLGLMAVLDIPINVMTAIVPALLIIIGSTEDIHLLAEYQYGKAQGMNRAEAIGSMGRMMGVAILLTFVTTYLGFLSISLTRLDLLQQFGVVASSGLLLNFLITVLLVPASLKLLGDDGGGGNVDRVSGAYGAVVDRLFQVIQTHRTAIALVLVSVSLLFAAGANLLRVNNNTYDYLEQDSEVLRRAHTVHERLSGTETLSIVLTGTSGTFLQVPYLEDLRLLQRFIEDSDLFDKSLSFADFVAVVHSGIDGEWPGTVYLPESSAVVKEYMNFIRHDYVLPLVSLDFGQARILVRHNINSSYELTRAVARIQDFIDREFNPDLEVRFTGQAYLNAQATDYMAAGQAKSLGMMMFVIFLIVSLLFVNLKVGLIAVVANLFPVVMLFGFMGFLGVPLDTGTAMIAAISLGISVDHTMHVMVRFQRKTRKMGQEFASLRETMREEAVPIVATAMALSVGFGSLALSSFPPVSWFGLLSALVMLLALVSTFVIIPLMLVKTRLVTVWDLLSMQLKSTVVEQCALFKGLGKQQIKRVILLSEVKEFVPDEVIVRQGRAGNELFVLLEGAVEVWQTRTDGSTYRVDKLVPGEIFGELALVSEQHRTADVVAIEASKVLVLRWSSIERIARMFPRASIQIYRNLSSIIGRRLSKAEIANVMTHDDATGAINRSHFQELLRFSVSNTARYGEPLTLAIFSVDRLGDFLKRGGSTLADSVLKELVREVLERTRGCDVLARYSWNEFALLMPNTDLEKGRGMAQRVSRGVGERRFGGGGGLTLSIGMVQLLHQEDLDLFLERAWSVHCKACDNGDDIVCQFPDVGAEPLGEGAGA